MLNNGVKNHYYIQLCVMVKSMPHRFNYFSSKSCSITMKLYFSNDRKCPNFPLRGFVSEREECS